MSAPALVPSRPPYRGDEAMAAMLRRAGSRLELPALRRLLAGVNAAPPAENETAWHRLVAPALTPMMIDQLEALRAELAAASPPGFGLDAWDASRVAALRAELARRGLGGFLCPRGDEHQGEYVAPYAERLRWLTGFTGSAGMAIVLADAAAIFVDGRYTLQVTSQVDGRIFAYRHLVEQPPADWLAENAVRGSRIGFDARLHTPDGLARLRAGAARAGAELVALEDDPIDAVWAAKPMPPIAPVVPHPDRFSGETSAAKRTALGEILKRDGASAAVISDPASVAWLLNVRGGDVPHTPLPLSFAILGDDGAVDWFVEPLKLAPELPAHLGNQVRIAEPDAFASALDALGKRKARVLMDAATVSVWIGDRLAAAGAEVVRGQDPCALPKARKNAGELAGARAAHLRDGAALARFCAWLAAEAPKGGLDELTVSDRLLALRRQGEYFRDTSFDTISGAGANGAIVHYRSTPSTNRPLAPGELYLVDSGAQYLDGTTDVTRTIAIGTPSPEHRDRFTRVLKGHIAVATARFPRGTTGSQLDPLARRALWEVGLDFDHGTGHGVGSYLSVHEGPHRISKVPNAVALEPGMIVSNEPGYYKTGAYGIRIENLVAVRAIDIDGAERPMLGFETLTLCPIDLALVDSALLDAAEIAWLDGYHARVRKALLPLVDAGTGAWLDRATRPLAAR
ncbi:MAG: aminopeptidase P family protein [Alphaproteobacteria bacterium]|nr:aminopeptidase P family protein [Alphaproteobacteria bacterium]